MGKGGAVPDLAWKGADRTEEPTRRLREILHKVGFEKSRSAAPAIFSRLDGSNRWERLYRPDRPATRWGSWAMVGWLASGSTDTGPPAAGKTRRPGDQKFPRLMPTYAPQGPIPIDIPLPTRALAKGGLPPLPPELLR